VPLLTGKSFSYLLRFQQSCAPGAGDGPQAANMLFGEPASNIFAISDASQTLWLRVW